MLSKANIPTLGMWETPFYFYDLDLLDRTLCACKQALDRYGYSAHFALKANAESRILDRIREAGFGADCVSGNEVALALRHQFEPQKIVFAGVGKSDREIRIALDAGIFSFNCESIPEMEVIAALAASMGTTARIALRINPDVDAHTHHYISTGKKENKFGISPWMFEDALTIIRNNPSLELIGLHFHIGSQITDLSVFGTLCKRVNELQQWFVDRGMQLPHLNLGGGLGINYQNPELAPIPDFATWFEQVQQNLQPLPGQQIHFEPGRSIVAQCGHLITRVLYIKEGLESRFMILDAGMNDLIRPALYQARHRIENISAQLRNTTQDECLSYEVVGPVCESSDLWENSALLPKTLRGDLIAIHSAGAYGQVMGMRYNQRDLAPAHYSDEL